MKKPWLAALLNVIPLGFGYIYLGRWGRFFLTFIGFPIAFFLDAVLVSVGFGGGGPPSGWDQLLPLILLFLLPALVAAFTARDAWRIGSRGGQDRLDDAEFAHIKLRIQATHHPRRAKDQWPVRIR